MKKLSLNEAALRIFSVVLGVFVWVIVLNTSNPIQTINISVPLEIYNEKILETNSLGLINGNIVESVTVTLKGRKNDLDKIIPANITAYVDYSVLTRNPEAEIAINILNRNEKVTVVTYEPKTIELATEKIIERTFPIEISVIGETADKYKLISVNVIPEQISVKGFKSDIDLIASAVVQIDISSANKDKALTKYVQFFNDRGDEITIFSKTVTVDVNASIGKHIIVNPVITGNAAEGYYYDGYESKLSAIYVTGPFDVISKIDEVKSHEINIDGIKENTEFEIQPVLANNISIISVDGELNLEVFIEPFVEKTIIYRKNDILLTGADYIDNIYEVATDSVEVKIKGKADILDTLLKTDINLLMEVGKLQPGIHRVPLEFEVSKDIEIVGDYTATVNVTARPVETTESSEG